MIGLGLGLSNFILYQNNRLSKKTWILFTGDWSDNGVWIDNANWRDS